MHMAWQACMGEPTCMAVDTSGVLPQEAMHGTYLASMEAAWAWGSCHDGAFIYMDNDNAKQGESHHTFTTPNNIAARTMIELPWT